MLFLKIFYSKNQKFIVIHKNNSCNNLRNTTKSWSWIRGKTSHKIDLKSSGIL